MLSLGQVAQDRASTANFDLISPLSRVGSVSCAAILNRLWKVVFLVVFEQASCARQEIDLLLICVKRSFLLWMRRSRGRDRPQICGRYHEGLAGQGNISGLNQITYIDWEDQTYSRNLISGWNSLRVQIGPPFSCYSTSALGSPNNLMYFCTGAI